MDELPQNKADPRKKLSCAEQSDCVQFFLVFRMLVSEEIIDLS